MNTSLQITLLRNCKSKEAEVKRINKELANIRSKFKVSVPLHGFFIDFLAQSAKNILHWMLWRADVDRRTKWF